MTQTKTASFFTLYIPGSYFFALMGVANIWTKVTEFYGVLVDDVVPKNGTIE